MNQLGKLEREYFLSLVELSTFPFFHFEYLLNRQERKHFQALDNVRIVDVSPVLEEIERRSFFGIEPNCTLFGLAHFLALGVEQQGNGHCVGVLAELLADKLRTAKHIRPLVVAAELHIAAVICEQLVEVVALHYHIVELKERQSALHTLFVALKRQHFVDREAGSDLAENVDVIKVEQPVRVVDHNSLIVREVDKAAHLLFEARNIVINILFCEHFTHIGFSRRVADHSRAAAEQGNRLVARHLQTLHKAERHKMTDVQAVRCRVEANVKRSFARVYHLAYLVLVGHLGDQASCGKFVE